MLFEISCGLGGASSPDWSERKALAGVMNEELFGSTQNPRFLDRGIRAYAAAVAAAAGAGGRATILSNLGARLLDRFETGNDPADLARARLVLDEAASACAADDPDRASILCNCATARLLEYRRRSDPSALNAALGMFESAAKASDNALEETAVVLCCWGTALLEKAELSGSPVDVEAAVQRYQDAVAVARSAGGDLAHCLSGLATALRIHFVWTGDSRSLYDAVAAAEEALGRTSKSSPRFASRLAALGVALAIRHQLTPDASDPDTPIRLLRRAAELAPGSDWRRHAMNLAVALNLRADSPQGSLADRDESIELLRSLIAEDHSGSPDPGVLAELADALVDRADSQPGSPRAYADIVEAMQRCAIGLQVADPGTLTHTRLLALQAEAEWGAYAANIPGHTLSNAAALYEEASVQRFARPEDRIRNALLSAHVACLDGRWESAVEVQDRAAALLHALLPIALQPLDAVRLVKELAEAGTDVAAASLHCNQTTEAVARCEEWRSVVLGPGRHVRQQWADLQHRRPDLAARLQSLSRELDQPGEQFVLVLAD